MSLSQGLSVYTVIEKGAFNDAFWSWRETSITNTFCMSDDYTKYICQMKTCICLWYFKLMILRAFESLWLHPVFILWRAFHGGLQFKALKQTRRDWGRQFIYKCLMNNKRMAVNIYTHCCSFASRWIIKKKPLPSSWILCLSPPPLQWDTYAALKL